MQTIVLPGASCSVLVWAFIKTGYFFQDQGRRPNTFRFGGPPLIAK
jgi:hypothetical protein